MSTCVYVKCELDTECCEAYTLGQDFGHLIMAVQDGTDTGAKYTKRGSVLQLLPRFRPEKCKWLKWNLDQGEKIYFKIHMESKFWCCLIVIM